MCTLLTMVTTEEGLGDLDTGLEEVEEQVWRECRSLDGQGAFELDFEDPQKFIYVCICVFICFRASPTAYSNSQARGGMGAAAVLLTSQPQQCRSKPCLRPALQLIGNAGSLIH